jgi:type IV secretion system protein VirD4
MLDSERSGFGTPRLRLFLDLYRDPIIAKNTSRSDFRIRDLMHYADPVSLYKSALAWDLVIDVVNSF